MGGFCATCDGKPNPSPTAIGTLSRDSSEWISIWKEFYSPAQALRIDTLPPAENCIEQRKQYARGDQPWRVVFIGQCKQRSENEVRNKKNKSTSKTPQDSQNPNHANLLSELLALQLATRFFRARTRIHRNPWIGLVRVGFL